MGSYLCREAEERQKISSHHIIEPSNIYKSVNLIANKASSGVNNKGRQYFPCQYLGKGSYGTSIQVFLKEKKQQKLVQKITKTEWLKENFLFIQAPLFKQLNNSFDFVKVLYLFLHGKKMYLISEKQKFGNLYTFMKRNPKQIQYHFIKQLCIKILLIIEKLHCRNIIYRSLRPENVIFIDRQGEFKLAELAFSKVCESAQEFVGPATYTPPQAYRGGTEKYTKNVDFWMLGVMIFQLIVGHTPFEGPNLAAIKQNVLSFTPETLKFPQQTLLCEDLIDFVTNLLQPNTQIRISFEEIKRHKFFHGECWDEDRDDRALAIIKATAQKQDNIPPNRIIFSNAIGKQNSFPQQFLEINYEDRSIYHSL